MAKAIWKGVVIAESDATRVVEGNHYFPPDALNRTYVRPSDTHTVCGWKGTASYFDVVVDGARNERAAWVYEAPKDAARHLAGWIGFWRGVEIVA